MGFGIMLIGYFVGFFMFLGRLSYLRVVGGAILCLSAYKLRAYNGKFNYLMYASVLNILFYGVLAFFDLAQLIGIGVSLGEAITTVFAICDIPITFLLHACLLLPIRSIAKETEADKIIFASTRNMIFYTILFPVQMITLLPFSLTRNLSVVTMIFSLVLSVFNLVLIFRSYATICDSSDVDMERKPSRFEFINRQREEFENKRRIADEEHARRRLEKLESKKGGRRSK